MVTSWKKIEQADGSYKWLGNDGRDSWVSENYLVKAWLAAGNVPEVVAYVEPPVIPPGPREFSKLYLRENLAAVGLEGLLDTFLTANTSFRSYWLDTNSLHEDHPMFISGMAVFKEQSGMAEAQIESLLEASQIELGIN